MRGLIYRDKDTDEYILFSPVNKNGRMYSYYTDDILEHVLHVGTFRFGEVEYDGKVYTERSLKIKQIYDNKWKKQQKTY